MTGLPPRRNWTSGLPLLTALIAAFVLFNANWVWVNRFRHGFVLNIDEAGYFSYAMIDYYGLHFGGLAGWFAALSIQSIQAPLTMALTSLLFAITGPHIIIGFAVPLAAGAGCVALTYALGNSLGLGRAALLGALLTAACPVILNYSRAYLFATPAAFCATLALVAILRSRNFRSIGWTVVFGLGLGLLPLARTMTVAFIPGLVLAALVSVLGNPEARLSRFRNLCLGLIISLLVAGPWFWENGVLVAHYLFNYGYDKHALEYGAKISVFSLHSLAVKFNFFLNAEIYLPEAFIICLGLVALLGIIIQAAVKDGVRQSIFRGFAAPILPVLIFNVTVLLALSSSGNAGSGFITPVIPALMAQTGWALWRVRLPAPVRVALCTLAIAAAAICIATMAVLTPPFARATALQLPLIGGATLTDGLGAVQGYEIRGGYGVPGALLGAGESQAWVQLSGWTAKMITEKYGPQANIMFAFRNVMFNVNTLNLQELIKFHSAFPIQMIDPIETGTSLAGYKDWLAKNGPQACILLTAEQAKGDFDPQVDPGLMKTAAQQSGFEQVLEFPTPDGQVFALWQHKDGKSPCPGH